MTSIAQGTETLNWGNKVFCTRVDVVITFFLFVTYATHARKVFNPYEVVVISKHTFRSAFLLGGQSLSAVKQQTPPAIGEGILDEAEDIIITTRMLQRRNIHQVTAQQNAAMLFQPLARILKDKMILTTNVFVA